MSILDDLQVTRPATTRAAGRLPVRAGAVGAVLRGRCRPCCFYFFVWNDQKPELLDRVAAEEQKLRRTFETKHAKAVNLEVYKQQLADIERSFGALLRQLPGKTEVPNLLVDISQTGVAAGLEEKLFQPAAESRRRISTPSCRSRSG